MAYLQQTQNDDTDRGVRGACTCPHTTEGGEATTTTFENEAHTSTLSPPAAKRKRSSFFADWENADDDDDAPVRDQLNLYISQRHAMADDRDLLGWWRINSSIYPKLAKLARSVLCIPASSSSNERVFNGERRTENFTETWHSGRNLVPA